MFFGIEAKIVLYFLIISASSFRPFLYVFIDFAALIKKDWSR